LGNTGKTKQKPTTGRQ